MVGPMAEDVAELGMGDGETLHLGRMFGLSAASIKDIDQRVKALERKS